MNDSEKKERPLKTAAGAGKKLDQAAESGAAGDSPGHRTPETEMQDGLPPSLQAHIGRHLRAVFDEVAREPIPDRLLQLLKDLERSGDK